MLVGRAILFNWGAVGWQVGTIFSRNNDKRITWSGLITNFYIHYEVDDDTVPTALGLDEYDGTSTFSWVLLEAA